MENLEATYEKFNDDIETMFYNKLKEALEDTLDKTNDNEDE